MVFFQSLILEISESKNGRIGNERVINFGEERKVRTQVRLLFYAIFSKYCFQFGLYILLYNNQLGSIKDVSLVILLHLHTCNYNICHICFIFLFVK